VVLDTHTPLSANALGCLANNGEGKVGSPESSTSTGGGGGGYGGAMVMMQTIMEDFSIMIAVVELR
jgi:hypothetical protein